MKKFLLTAALAAVTVTSFASVSEAHHRRHFWGPSFGIVIGGPRVVYSDPYYGCYVKKSARYNRWGELVIKKVKVCG